MISKKSLFKTNSILLMVIVLGLLFSVFKIIELDSRLSKIENHLETPNPTIRPLK